MSVYEKLFICFMQTGAQWRSCSGNVGYILTTAAFDQKVSILVAG